MQRWVQRVERYTLSMHPPALGGAGGLVVGGGIGGANGTGGGGEQHQQGEIEKLNEKIEEMKEQAREESRITMDNLCSVRNERVEDDELRTEEREAMEGRLNDLEKELAKQASLLITPAERASVASLEQQVPALEARVVPLEKDVPAMHGRSMLTRKQAYCLT